MKIGQYELDNNIFVAPMAGVTDRPFRLLCRKLGAGYAVSEMAASNPLLWETVKTARRLNHDGEKAPIAVQIVGANPDMMAQSAVFNIQKGAQIIDINMGCPAKKVCHVASGSALMKDEKLVADILQAVFEACQPYDVPVTLKIRTGWDRANKNVVTIAKMAEEIGLSAIAVHGRTRADKYEGEAEYDTIAQVVSEVSIPVIANGDIDSPEKAKYVLDYTQAAAVMIGRAAQGNPWIFQQIDYFLKTGQQLSFPSNQEIATVLLEHLEEHYTFYGSVLGVKTARKHIAWYVQSLKNSESLKQKVNRSENASEQYRLVKEWFDREM
ncbi:tRNA-dihydrouridine synthase B [Basilea psittacipulmonis DSM 24701]|uniref:tRNA-dihydrouridine synthase B n=1 Tax=Basilea psittacipulmonis DSM 24701 TaxID=1072685 RepID=A0A077DED3_9BURK|nr:tRNA dihydrouridine synthase DusB [Basilea psittacipulmonis]AIL33074.1 tRNA-dihydrouridine synthase B [Basilea psittacipulmonis DSM 24701]